MKHISTEIKTQKGSNKSVMGITDEHCNNCSKDWTKCGTCPIMMQWVKEHKAEMSGKESEEEYGKV